MSFVPKNYTTDGGDKTVIGGELEIKEGAKVSGLPSGDSFIVFDMQGISVAPALDGPMEVTEYIPVELFEAARDGSHPVLLKGCQLQGRVFSMTGFTVGADTDEGGTDDVIVGMCGYPRADASADLVTIITILFFRSGSRVMLRISPNSRLAELLYYEIPVTGISLSENGRTADVGDTFSLTATVEPEDAENKSVSWDTSDSAVITITSEYGDSADFEVVGPGEATITVTTSDGGYTDTCEVTVEEPVPDSDPDSEDNAEEE